MIKSRRQTVSSGRDRLADGAGRNWMLPLFWVLTLASSVFSPVRGELQFDVFVGFDGVIREAGWFPVACEVNNDGPAFDATIELSTPQVGSGQTRRFAVELPTNTRKRIILPVFSGGGGLASWDAKLFDDRGKLRAEQANIRAREIPWRGVLLGAVSRSFGGLAKFPGASARNFDLRPEVGRIPVEQFPDTPIALESLSALYLNSEKALEFTLPQIDALNAWIAGGGHLILAVEQPADVNSTPWLRNLVPFTIDSVSTITVDASFRGWLRSVTDESSAVVQVPNTASRNRRVVRPVRGQRVSSPPPAIEPDFDFEGTELPIVTGTNRDARVLLEVAERPLIVSAHRGRGEVTVLNFSPEREPIRSWKNLPWFWAKLAGVSTEMLGEGRYNRYAGSSIDGIFGSLIESRQVRKLPVEWLLALLVVYLVVIGPFDQWWLKKINKQMLTWVTFPAYVALFSILIYFIGYKLRAGEAEWNELHLVDILPKGQGVELRGRSYGSMYSPVNARYELKGAQRDATLRGEFSVQFGRGRESSRAEVDQLAEGYDARIYVPVWTSQLYIGDWRQAADAPLAAQVVRTSTDYRVTINNLLPRELSHVRIVADDRIFEVGDVPANESKELTLRRRQGISLRDFVNQNSGGFREALRSRNQALGQTFRLENPETVSVAASFIEAGDANAGRAGSQNFVYPNGMDLTSLIGRGDAAILAWDAGHLQVPPMNQFKVSRQENNTLLRLVVPIQ